jgi:ribosomal protein S18 acetylase RimI-like enzyme
MGTLALDGNGMNVQVIRADDSHLESLLPLFNGYRKFYEQSHDEDGARAYLEARMNNDEAVIFLAVNPDDPNRHVGFVLLYPTFDSVEMTAIWVLYDLFVDPGYRQHGTGRLLMNAASNFCQTTGASRIELATAISNKKAQALYESLGYERDTEFYQYSLELSAPGA